MIRLKERNRNAMIFPVSHFFRCWVKQTPAVPGGPKILFSPCVPWSRSSSSIRTPSLTTPSRFFGPGAFKGIFVLVPVPTPKWGHCLVLGLVAFFLSGFTFRLVSLFCFRVFGVLPVSVLFFRCFWLRLLCVLHLASSFLQ